MDVLAILLDVVKQPALIVGIFSFIGLMALRKPFHKVLTGTLRPVLGYIMMMAGANIIVANLEPLGDMIHEGFHITGVVPSNEAIVASASRLLGTETMFILVAGLMVFSDKALLGLGLMLAAGEVPRIAGAFGLDTTTRANIMSAVYTAQAAVNTTRTIVQAATK